MESGWKQLVLRRDGLCCKCGIKLPVGTSARWNVSTRKIACLTHDEAEHDNPIQVPESAPTEVDRGTASGSAHAESERRSRKREARINNRFPRMGKYILAITDEPQSTKAWKIGADGERAVGKQLDSLAKEYGFEMLHDRLIPKSHANIDHIAVTSSGVFVFDSKNYKGVVRVKELGGLFTRRTSELWVGSRNCTKLVTSMQRQVNIVREILTRGGIQMPVIGVLAFYAADWSLPKFLRTQEQIDGVLINSKGIEAILSKPGTYSVTEISTAIRILAEVLKSAT